MNAAEGLSLFREELRREREIKAELLTALRRIVESWEQTGDVGVDAFAAGRDAITRAEGRAESL